MNADCELKVCTIYLAVVGKGWWEGNEGERRVDASRRTDFFPLPIQICDFGLARGFAPGGDEERGGAGFMTECEFFFISFSLSLSLSFSLLFVFVLDSFVVGWSCFTDSPVLCFFETRYDIRRRDALVPSSRDHALVCERECFVSSPLLFPSEAQHFSTESS